MFLRIYASIQITCFTRAGADTFSVVLDRTLYDQIAWSVCLPSIALMDWSLTSSDVVCL